MTRRPVPFLTLLLVLSLSGAIGGCDATASLTEQEHIERAKDYEDQGNLRGSIVELKNAIQKNPDSPQARLLLGQVYLKAGFGADAEKEFTRAEKLGVSRETLKPQLGDALLLMGEYQRVLDEINPGEQTSRANLARIHQIRADALLRKGQIQDACNLYQQSLDLDSSHPSTYWGLTQCAVANQDRAKARTWLDAALALNTRQATTWVFIGDLEQLNGNRPAALTAYTRALKLEPGHADALKSRAALQMALGNLEAAEADVNEVVKLAPKSLAAHYLRALLEFERKKFPAARESLQEVFKISSSHLPSILLAGATDYALGSYRQAETHLVRYLSRFPDHGYGRRLLAATLIKQDQADRALDTLAPLLSPDTRDVQVLVLAAEAHRIKREPAREAAYLARAAAIDPGNAGIQAQLGFSHLTAGDSQLAIAELSRAASLSPDQHQADVMLVMAHLERKDYDQALSAIEALEKKLKDSAATHTMRGNALFGKNDTTGARKSFEHALRLDPGFFPAVASLAELDLRDKKPDAARKRYQRLLNHDRNSLPAMMALAELAAADKREKDYVNWLERAAEAHPEAIAPRAVLVRHLLARQEHQKALALANEAVRTHPDNPAALDLLGSVHVNMKNPTGTLSTFSRLAQLAPSSPDAQLRLAVAQIANNRLADARTTVQKALKLAPGHEPSLDVLIQLEMQAKQPDQALQVARQIQADKPTSPFGHEREGDIHLSQKRYPMAVKAYEQALAKGAGSAGLIKVHRAHVLAGNPAANQKLEQWLAQHPRDSAVRIYTAEYYASIGRIPEAIAAYQTLLSQTPDAAIALNNLANLYQKQGDKRALATAEHAYRIDPAHPAILDTLGWLLVQNGQAARGKRLIDQALVAAPGNPDIRYHRAMALLKLDDKARAHSELESLLRDAPGFSHADAARAQLRQR